MIDLIGELRRIMNIDAGETFDQATDSLEALSIAIAALLAPLTPVTGTHAHANNVAEQVVFTIPVATSMVDTMYLDLVNLTQNADVRVYHQIDGANYRIIETFNWTTGMDDGLYFRAVAIDALTQVTIQSTALEGAARNIPWKYLFRS